MDAQEKSKERCVLDVALADAKARVTAAEDKIAAQAATLKEQAEHVHDLEVCALSTCGGFSIRGP